jgi:hypothetical protein
LYARQASLNLMAHTPTTTRRQREEPRDPISFILPNAQLTKITIHFTKACNTKRKIEMN